MAIDVGTKAPDFTLKSKSSGDVTDVTLSSNFGSKNTVLLFVPLAFTGVCTGEFCDITAGLGAYTDLNADVIGISVDSPFAQEAWAQKENIGIGALIRNVEITIAAKRLRVEAYRFDDKSKWQPDITAAARMQRGDPSHRMESDEGPRCTEETTLSRCRIRVSKSWAC